MVHDSVADCPWVMELGETLSSGVCGALTVRVAPAGALGAGHDSVWRYGPAAAGVVAVEPEAGAGASRPGSWLDQLQVQGLGLTLAKVFHDSVAPLPSTTVVVERLTVGCLVTVTVTGCEAVATG